MPAPRNQHLRRRLIVICHGCSETFEILPYLKRQTNYCSLSCYWNTNRKKIKKFCLVCNKEFTIKKYLVGKGYGLYCSRECHHRTYPERIEKKCPECSCLFYIWPSQVGKSKFCSKKCADDHMRDYLHFVCKQCKKDFQIPRSDFKRGRGVFCSRKCFFKYNGPSSLEKKVEKVLNKLEIKYLREVKFQRFYVDFLVQEQNLVIECDGEYWHMNPKIQERDKRKDQYLLSLGYKVLRLTGSKIIKLTHKELAEIIHI